MARMTFVEALALAGKLISAWTTVEHLEEGERGELPVIRTKAGGSRWRLGPIPVQREREAK